MTGRKPQATQRRCHSACSYPKEVSGGDNRAPGFGCPVVLTRMMLTGQCDRQDSSTSAPSHCQCEPCCSTFGKAFKQALNEKDQNYLEKCQETGGSRLYLTSRFGSNVPGRSDLCGTARWTSGGIEILGGNHHCIAETASS